MLKHSYFPIKIRLQHTSEIMICNQPEDIPINKRFKILETNVKTPNVNEQN